MSVAAGYRRKRWPGRSHGRPDLDGDGTRDLVAISRFNGKNPSPGSSAQPDEPERIYVDAISGKSGHPLWWWSVDLPVERFTRIWKPRWWTRGPDGWPLLAIQLGGSNPVGFEANLPPTHLHGAVIHLLEASTGRERHTVPEFTNVGMADLNGDGLADLWGEALGELRAFRGEAPEAWRTLDRFYSPLATYSQTEQPGGDRVDFDGDGIGDALSVGVQNPAPRRGRQPAATPLSLAPVPTDTRSGKQFSTRAKPGLNPAAATGIHCNRCPCPPAISTATVRRTSSSSVTWHRSAPKLKQAASLPIQLLSGRTGKLLWRTGPLPLGFSAQGYSYVNTIDARAVLANGTPDLFVRHGSPFVKPGSSPPAGAGSTGRPSLARVSGRDGRIIWDIALAEAAPADFNTYVPSAAYADLNADGGLDSLLVIPPIPGTGIGEYRLRADLAARRKGAMVQAAQVPDELCGHDQGRRLGWRQNARGDSHGRARQQERSRA